MSEQLGELVDSLLYEGYALYPYTPRATKNATPTPFGIVYPPTYAAGLSTTHDHVEMRCRFEGEGEISAELFFLTPAGRRRHLTALGDHRVDGLELRLSLEVAGGLASFRVENRTSVPQGLDRGGALGHSVISAHPVMRIEGGRFLSALEGGASSVNTWPVLAADDDSVMLGAAIVLPDHPRLAPESLGNLFDSTEIEEALLLHVNVLTDEERASIEDPVVRAMVERATRATPEEMLALHGRMELRDPVTTSPPVPSAAVRDPSAGEREATFQGVTYRRGGKLMLRPGPEADLHARMLDGRRATIERIFTALDGKLHLAVTVDDDPGQELLRETGRFLFFFPDEVEVL